MATKGRLTFEKEIFSVVSQAIGNSISGQCYLPDCRPLNSKKEDAIVVVTTATGEQIQEGRAKVNIYVADLPSKAGNRVPNVSRLRALESLDITIIDSLNASLPDYNFWFSSMTDVLSESVTKEHFLNINLGFKRNTF